MYKFNFVNFYEFHFHIIYFNVYVLLFPFTQCTQSYIKWVLLYISDEICIFATLVYNIMQYCYI